MNNKQEPFNVVSYQELYDKYLDLQSRVTKFSATEQKLINIKDQLDHELELYKRLNEFNANAICCADLNEFFQLTTESIIDIFETELATVFVQDISNESAELVYTEGIRDGERASFLEELNQVRQYFVSDSEDLMLSPEMLSEYIVDNQLAHVLISHNLILNEKLSIILFAAISQTRKPLYSAYNVRHKTLFSIFIRQVESFVRNMLISKENRNQLQQIKASELELKKLSLIATKAKSGVVITDAFGRVEWVNEAFEKTSGYTLPEILGRKPKDFLRSHDPVNADARNKLKEFLSRKENVETVLVNYDKSGKKYYNQLEITPVFDEKGQHINFISLQKDITVEENYKHDILRANSRFELITTGSEIGIWEWDLQENKLTWNDVQKKHFGIAEETPSTSWYSIWETSLHPEDKERVLGALHRLQSGEVDKIEHEYRICRGESLEIRYIKSQVIAEFDQKNELARLIGSSMDFTEVRLHELELVLKNEELQKINGELDHFVYRISHDLRSPLLAIKGLISVMRITQDPIQNESYLNMIETSTGRLDNTILEILDYSRNSRLELNEDLVDINQLIHEIYEDLEHLAEEHIDFQYTSNVTSQLVTDKTRLSTVIKNVLSNAIKYRRRGIETKLEVKLTHDLQTDYLTIQIKDNGEGISPESVNKVFDMFYRASTSSFGTGLGLYICKEIIQKMNGTIDIHSVINEGTVVNVLIPINTIEKL